MNDFAARLAALATMHNLMGVALDLVLIVAVFGLLRALHRRVAKVLPREGGLGEWLAELEVLTQRLGAWSLALTLLADLGLNLWLMGRAEDLITLKRQLLSAAFAEHGQQILVHVGVAFVAGTLNLLLLRVFTKLLAQICAWVQSVDAIESNDESIAATFEHLRWGIERGAWLGLLTLGATRSPLLPAALDTALIVVLRVFAIYALARVTWASLEIVVTTLDGLAKRAAAQREKLSYYDNLEPLFPTLRRSLEATIMVLGFAFAAAQIQSFEAIAGWGVVGMEIVALMFVAQVLSTLFEFGLRELLIKAVEEKEKQRRLTVLPMVASVAKYVIFGFAIVTSLAQVGIDPVPVLAGAGIAGVAIGFGAQSLITDLMCGIFILWENYFVVGDFVTIGEQEGFVESISLRVTRLRDEEGRVHIVPNGKIEAIVNYSKDYVAAEVSVSVSYEVDLDEVYAALEEVGAWVGREVEAALEPSEIEGIDAFSDFAVVIKLSTKVLPGTHLLVQRIVRRQIKRVFDRRGIHIAYPRQVIELHGAERRELLAALSANE